MVSDKRKKWWIGALDFDRVLAWNCIVFCRSRKSRTLKEKYENPALHVSKYGAKAFINLLREHRRIKAVRVFTKDFIFLYLEAGFTGVHDLYLTEGVIFGVFIEDRQ